MGPEISGESFGATNLLFEGVGMSELREASSKVSGLMGVLGSGFRAEGHFLNLLMLSFP